MLKLLAKAKNFSMEHFLLYFDPPMCIVSQIWAIFGPFCASYGNDYSWYHFNTTHNK